MTVVKERKSSIWEREPDNHYVEPVWVSERLFDVEQFAGPVVDPCAGFGNVVTAARAAGRLAWGYDLRKRPQVSESLVLGGHDFFGPGAHPEDWPVGSIVSNPPYGKRPSFLPGERSRWEEEFIRLALGYTTNKVAVFLDANWSNSASRGEWLRTLPLYRIYHVGPRPSCPPGPVYLSGKSIGNGRTDYAWYVFLHGFAGHPTVHWITR